MRVIYTPIYVIHVIYALEHFILNIFCVNRRIYYYFIRLFITFRYGYFEKVYVITSQQIMTSQSLGGHAPRRDAVIGCQFLLFE